MTILTLTFDLFDLESVSCTALLMSDPHKNFYYLRLSVTGLRVLNIWSHHISVIWNTAHAPCHV